MIFFLEIDLLIYLLIYIRTRKERFYWKISNFSWIQIRKVILLTYQNNYVERSKLLEYQNFLQHCSLFLRFQQNYFDGLTKLFSDLYLVKFEIPQQNHSFRVEYRTLDFNFDPRSNAQVL